ncbi:MAG TPA: HlyD family efflux transporter periplasmic adaptor subunit [Povalibacter sp.]|uniref:efflux RND transporter periplasmic adaptor subunit n=1 Tax=Povalibacter sp. TaxID=1962978 RepID=UPI002C890EA3|nr:HlyD family efflux transporter periplasmic adaptor subunit [Povalibacter sp.]HMN47351.1 HlyD family efflux transporter periplasmic adaptor subunit [Povalibacter sp.]
MSSDQGEARLAHIQQPRLVADAPADRVTGAAMDEPLPKRRRTRLIAAIAAAVVLVAVLLIRWVLPNGLQVAAANVRIAAVQRAMFRNDVVVRSTVAPLRTIMLDSLASGRVEEIFASDGATVRKGDLLFRLLNPQLRLELVAREADRAQQISNVSTLRVALEAAQTEHDRQLLQLDFDLDQAQKLLARYVPLAQEGVISKATLERAQDDVLLRQQAVESAQKRTAIEMQIKREGIRQMEQAIERLDAGLQEVNKLIDGLAVRAPIAGRLTNFSLQLGEIVKADQRIGRIDDPGEFKVEARIDEYFLGSVAVGRRGHVSVEGRTYEVEMSHVFPQITDGRFSAELRFAGEAPPGLQPGQSLETRIVLGETTPALILPNDAYMNDTGGSWVYVVAADGTTAERRAIRVGRRNNSQVEVASGLAIDERVIVSSYAAYGAAERLQIAR